MLRESLQPYISDSSLHWSPPEGFSLLDSTPKSLGTVYSGSTHTAFALLKREESPCTEDVCVRGSASIVGQCDNEQLRIDMGPVLLPPLTHSQSHELVSMLDRVATWSKLQDMEYTLMSGSRKNSHTEADDTQEPEPKRVKLNGSTLNGRMVDSELYDELVELSLLSGIPCGFTSFRGDGLVEEILPYKQPSSNCHSSSNTKKAAIFSNQKRLAQLRKMQKQNHNRRRHDPRSTPAPLSMSSIVTTVGSTLKSFASSFGLVSEPAEHQNGHRIDDHLQYQSQKKSSLHWDEMKGKLVYPSYYRTNSETSSGRTKTPYPHSRVANGHRSSLSMESSSDDEDFSISDTESDSSLDPDWDGLRRPSELRPLIQMQLYSGAWPMVRPFSYAVGVPLEEVRKLLEKETKQPSELASQGTSEEEDEKSNVWTTALAVACMEEYFPHLKAEWEVVGLKGREWLKENLRHETDLSLDEVTEQSRRLVTKWL